MMGLFRTLLSSALVFTALVLVAPSHGQNLEAYQFDEPAQEALFKELIVKS